jgi:ABC-type polysaccharide/polyol phosphate transport system ATPase subunit
LKVDVQQHHSPRGPSAEQVIIDVQALSKSYHIYERPQDRLKEAFVSRLDTLRSRLAGILRLAHAPRSSVYYREFHALKEVSLQVRRGETLGIIGRNGAGKSTLLQLLAGTLTPTDGWVDIRGRVAALLELGTGFNPEFTGRENVVMSGLLLGLHRAQIEARFDEIAAFADIGAFIDQPVRTYSSGMYVRLAFAVMTALDPDVLIIDEALSVGDLAFRNKCMARIKRLSDAGTTILFVSHDLSTIQVMCDRVLWLDQGRVREVGDPIQVCRDYYVGTLGGPEAGVAHHSFNAIPQQYTGLGEFADVRIVDWSSNPALEFNVGDDVAICFSLRAHDDLGPAVVAVSVYRSDGDWLLGQTSREGGITWPGCAKGERLHGRVTLTRTCLAPGVYRIALAAYSADLSLCYALTDIFNGFSVRASYPTWGKFVHPMQWENLGSDRP